MKMSPENMQKLIQLKERNIWLEGNILKVLDFTDNPLLEQYVKEATERDRDIRKKRLEITKQVQSQNRDLIEKEKENERLMGEIQKALQDSERDKEFIEKQNKELISWKDENEKIATDLKDALESAEIAKKEAERAKDEALNDLDLLQKKSQTELIGTIVRVALVVILSIGVITTGMYMMALYTNKDTQIIGSTWSNMFGILLTNAFSIIGTIMGVKYASEKKGGE